MDDGIVLNLALDDQPPSTHGTVKKGGRWTDRLKSKRAVKRKARGEEKHALAARSDVQQRPTKRPRRDSELNTANANVPTIKDNSQPSHSQSSRPQQIISSLFTSNPTIDTPSHPAPRKPAAKPSNAPLEASAFAALGLDPLLISHLESKMNILKPTAIQRAALPPMLSSIAENNHERDIFIQSQTGSGKTLSFLLPIIQDLLPLSSLSYIDRSIGTLAIIIAPTRELAKQISDVLESVLQMRLRAEDESGENSARLTRWLVSGLLIGGATRTHEKARLRKGVPILVSTPGRLLDHLQNTSAFNVGKCRWLVMDEADRLMELGFEETIKGIIQGLDGRRRLAVKAIEEGKSMEVGGWDWERRRRTILCSATIREDVQKLAGTTLNHPLMIKATEVDKDESGNTNALESSSAVSEKFTPPSQLAQKYVIVPLKMRLVALIALLRTLVAENQARRGAKIIVFLSCTDSVDFHWHLLGGTSMANEGEAENIGSDEDSDDEADQDEARKEEKIEAQSPLLPGASIYRLHGSLPTATRLAVLKGFSGAPSKGKEVSALTSILLCTSVASRGLDLPLVRAVVQYDLPTEGGATEYVHRIGRTARAGKGGEAWSIVAPSETEWVKWVEDKMQSSDSAGDGTISLTHISIDNVLRTGFGGKGNECEGRATDVQLSFERWILNRKENAELARKAFLSHVRAYATHPSNEKHIFHIRHLHLGHLAKAFALREAPSSVNTNKTKAHGQKQHQSHGKKEKIKSDSKDQVKDVSKVNKEWERDRSGDAEKRMQTIVRAQGRLSKKGGMMMSSGTSEFQIASTADLEKLVRK